MIKCLRPWLCIWIFLQCKQGCTQDLAHVQTQLCSQDHRAIQSPTMIVLWDRSCCDLLFTNVHWCWTMCCHIEFLFISSFFFLAALYHMIWVQINHNESTSSESGLNKYNFEVLLLHCTNYYLYFTHIHPGEDTGLFHIIFSQQCLLCIFKPVVFSLFGLWSLTKTFSDNFTLAI